MNIKKLGLIAILLLTAVAFAQQIQLKPGDIAGKHLYLADSRNYPFCEIVPIMGTPPVAQFYNTSGASDCPPDKFDAIDAKKLAAQVGADTVWLNPRRFWVMDKFWADKGGETVDFDGVKATWGQQ